MNTGQQGQLPRQRTGRDRRHLFPGRHRAVNARFTEDEYAELTAAADLAGLTPTGFCAQAALDAARDLHTATELVEHQALGDLQAELFQARVALNHLRAKLSRTQDPAATPDHLATTIDDAARSLTWLDDVVSLIHHQLAQHPSTTQADPDPEDG